MMGIRDLLSVGKSYWRHSFLTAFIGLSQYHNWSIISRMTREGSAVRVTKIKVYFHVIRLEKDATPFHRRTNRIILGIRRAPGAPSLLYQL